MGTSKSRLLLTGAPGTAGFGLGLFKLFKQGQAWRRCLPDQIPVRHREREGVRGAGSSLPSAPERPFLR